MKLNKKLTTLSKDIQVYDAAIDKETVGNLYIKGMDLVKAGRFTELNLRKLKNPNNVIKDTRLRNTLVYSLKHTNNIKKDNTLPTIKSLEQYLKNILREYFLQFNLPMDQKDETRDFFLEEQWDNLFFPYISMLFYKKDRGHYAKMHTDEMRLGLSNNYSQLKAGKKVYHTNLFSMIIYLTHDNQTYTEFPYQNIKVNCRPGRVLIFPSRWPFVHRATAAVADKLIINTGIALDPSGLIAPIFNQLDSIQDFPVLKPFHNGETY